MNAAVAAAVLVVVASVAVVSSRRAGPSDDVLLVAAARTAALESARLGLDATFDVDVKGVFGDSYVVRATGAGILRFPDRLRFSYDLRFVEGEGPDSSADRIVVGDDSWTRAPGEGWRRSDSEGWQVGNLLYRPDIALEALRASGGKPREVGTRTIDGVRAKGYRFTVPFDFFPAPFPPKEDRPGSPWSVEAWVGDDDNVLRRIQFVNTGTSDDPALLDWRTSLTLTLSDFALDDAVEPPRPDELEAG